MEKSKAFLEYIVTSLVEFPNEVNIDSQIDEMGVLLTLHVSKEDMGKVIGREGNTAKAIRTLLRVIGMRDNARINLKIAEPTDEPRTLRNHTATSGGYVPLEEALDNMKN